MKCKYVLLFILAFLFSVFISCSAKKTVSSHLDYNSIEPGKDFTNLHADIVFFTHRTDLDSADYYGVNYEDYISDFNKVYPHINVKVISVKDYSSTSRLLLSDKNWGDIMMVPSVPLSQYKDYFESVGTLSDLMYKIRFVDAVSYENEVYGIPTAGNVHGIVYNKKVFRDAGIEMLPSTPDEFIDDLVSISLKTDAVPLYTNYASGWALSGWDSYIGCCSTGSIHYLYHEMLYDESPFRNYGDGTHPYAVYKILYDAVKNGLVEKDYTSSDWEESKRLLNEGKIGCMVLGSWAFSQIQGAGTCGSDVGYMPFPVTVNGTQYAPAAADYFYGINRYSSKENKLASLIFIKWMTECSGYTENEKALSVIYGDERKDEMFLSFENVQYSVDAAVFTEDISRCAELNRLSGLQININGVEKMQELMECAFSGKKTFNQLMDEWNKRWSDAMNALLD